MKSDKSWRKNERFKSHPSIKPFLIKFNTKCGMLGKSKSENLGTMNTHYTVSLLYYFLISALAQQKVKKKSGNGISNEQASCNEDSLATSIPLLCCIV